MSTKFKMRPLQLKDIFVMSKILKKMDLKMEISEGIDQTQMGVQFIQRVLENIHLAESEVNAFLADLVGISKEEFSELELQDAMEIFTLFKEQKGLADFLKQAGK